ncbi:MAG: hypothetical protein HYV00_01660 [Deltaproteobacteria bacterium]|nr:hypothetical protein [Deltaproteobacteria bacterium]
MSSWQLIFLQSKANDGLYDEDGLPQQNWKRPQGTWFQKRLRYVREAQRQLLQRIRPRGLELASLGQ